MNIETMLQKGVGADGDLLPDQRKPCYAAWTAYRDAEEARGDCADIADFRSGFMFGWAARESTPSHVKHIITDYGVRADDASIVRPLVIEAVNHS